MGHVVEDFLYRRLCPLKSKGPALLHPPRQDPIQEHHEPLAGGDLKFRLQGLFHDLAWRTLGHASMCYLSAEERDEWVSTAAGWELVLMSLDSAPPPRGVRSSFMGDARRNPSAQAKKKRTKSSSAGPGRKQPKRKLSLAASSVDDEEIIRRAPPSRAAAPSSISRPPSAKRTRATRVVVEPEPQPSSAMRRPQPRPSVVLSGVGRSLAAPTSSRDLERSLNLVQSGLQGADLYLQSLQSQAGPSE